MLSFYLVLHLLATTTSFSLARPTSKLSSRATTTQTFNSSAAAAYQVQTSQLPLFNGLDVQDSWAGRINGTSVVGNNDLFFWYFPSTQTGGSNKLTIWLNGGPGCSSLEGVTQENGPFIIAPGSQSPVVNKNAWTGVSDMLYVEQPAGVGYSLGSNANLTGESAIGLAFYGFLEGFYSVFPELLQKELYISGESYAGMYIPWIADRIVIQGSVDANALPIKLKGLIINDGVYSSFQVSQQIPLSRFITAQAATLQFPQSVVSSFLAGSQSCGYEAFWDQIKFPMPQGTVLQLPQLESAVQSTSTIKTCDLWSRFYNTAYSYNKCFNIYRITDTCPTPTDIIGDGSYLSRPDVQAALHVPNSGTWSECSSSPFVDGLDSAAWSETKLPGLLGVMPVLLWHGLIDSILLPEGDLITIQNMTWNGAQGFSSYPNSSLTLNGVKAGTWGAERNLTLAFVENAGHMIPEDQPGLGLAIFSSFLATGGIGNGVLTSSTGGVVAGAIGSTNATTITSTISGTQTAKGASASSTTTKASGVAPKAAGLSSTVGWGIAVLVGSALWAL
ncbi:alpha/beta-hydrolase [Meredithblackwellia eburnea MCA 4105]